MAPIVLAQKKDGSLRFCVDSLKENYITARGSYPLPSMNEYIYFIGDAAVFSILEDNREYWQVNMQEAGRDKTAFIYHHGLYRLTGVPSGWRNDPGTFQQTNDVILQVTARPYISG